MTKTLLCKKVREHKTNMKTGIYFLLALLVLHAQELFAVTEAEAIYFETCFVCHGDDGTGNMPGVPDLTENAALFSEKESVIVARLKAGIQKPGNIAMPPKGGNPALNDEQLLDVLRFVKRLVKRSIYE